MLWPAGISIRETTKLLQIHRIVCNWQTFWEQPLPTSSSEKDEAVSTSGIILESTGKYNWSFLKPQSFWIHASEFQPTRRLLLYLCWISLVTKFSKAAQFATRPQRPRQSPATSSDWASQWCRWVSWQESFGLIPLLSEVRGQRDIGKRVDWRQEAERYRCHQPKYRSTWYFCW